LLTRSGCNGDLVSPSCSDFFNESFQRVGFVNFPSRGIRRSVGAPVGTSALLVWLIVNLLVPFRVACQTTYYVSADGNDASDGRSTASAWNSIDKVNAKVLVAGDQILFRRGDVFRGQINLRYSGQAEQPIVFGAYGSRSSNPVISGAVSLAGWEVHSGQVYRAAVSRSVGSLFVDGVQMVKARYPNSGFLSIGSGTSLGITSTGLSQGEGYWNGATVRMRTAYWSYESRVVASSTGGEVNFATASEYVPQAGWGFYLDGKLSELDVAGEWHCDSSSQRVYLWCPEGNDPNWKAVEGSVCEYGIKGQELVSHILVRDLSFRYQLNAAISFAWGSSDISIVGNEVSHSLGSGIELLGQETDCLIEGNSIWHCCGVGISLVSHQRTTVRNNTLRSIGLWEGYGVSGDNGMSGIVCTYGSNNTFSGNRVDSVGYIGMRIDGGNSLVERNIVSNVLLKLNDGGAYYCYGSWSTGTIWRDNIAMNIVGNTSATTRNDTLAAGMYFDYATNKAIVERNTVINSRGYGVLLENRASHTIRRNTIYGAGVAQIWLNQRKSPIQDANRIVGNVFYALHEDQSAIMWKDSSVTSLGVLDSNYYCNPYDSFVVRRVDDNLLVVKRYTLDQWVSASQQDRNSRSSRVRWNRYCVTDSSAASLVQNGEFNGSVNGWSKHPSTCDLSYNAEGGLDGGVGRFSWGTTDEDNKTAEGKALLISNVVSIQAGQMYQLGFSIRSTRNGIIGAQVRQHHDPYSQLSAIRLFPMGLERKDHNAILVGKAADQIARLEFSLATEDSIFWIDNVRLRPVTAVELDPTVQSPLLLNTSDSPRVFNLGSSMYRDLDGNEVSGSVELGPCSSAIFVVAGEDSGSSRGGTGSLPGEVELYPNFPNPFNPSTVIRYYVPYPGVVTLVVIDLLGRLAKEIVNEYQTSGYHQCLLGGSSMATGVYFYRLSSAGVSLTRKLMVLK
jgi:hypothetical protein